MHDLVDFGDGLAIVADTGEIVSCPPGEDRLSYVAARLADAQAQRQGWEKAERALKQVFLREQGERRAQYGDVAVSIRAGRELRKFDATAYRRDVEYGEEMSKEEFRALARAAKDFDPGLLEGFTLNLVTQHTAYETSRPAVYVDRVRREAPKVRKAPDVPDESDDLADAIGASILVERLRQGRAGKPAETTSEQEN